MDDNPKAVGRPSEFCLEYCEMLIEHMAQGLSFESFGGIIGVGRTSLYRWADLYSEFRDAKEKGESRGQLFFEQMMITAVMGKVPNFQVGAWIFTMKNRFGWSDRDKTQAYESVIRSNLMSAVGRKLEGMTEDEFKQQARRYVEGLRQALESDESPLDVDAVDVGKPTNT